MCSEADKALQMHDDWCGRGVLSKDFRATPHHHPTRHRLVRVFKCDYKLRCTAVASKMSDIWSTSLLLPPFLLSCMMPLEPVSQPESSVGFYASTLEEVLSAAINVPARW